MIYYPPILWLVFISVIFFIFGLEMLFKKQESFIYNLIFRKKNIYDFAYKVGPMAQNYISAGKQMDIANKLVYANHPYNLTLEAYIGVRIIFLILALVLGIILISFGLPSFILIILFTIGYLIPISILNNKAKERQDAVKRDLPGMVGLLATSVKAGVELGTAFEIISMNIPGVLGEELRKTMKEISTGSQRAKALKKMGNRIGVDILDRFIETINTAEERGGMNISQVLEDFTGDVRAMTKLDMEEKANKLPTKMLLPIFTCVFIPMLILLLTPVGILFLHEL